SMLACALLATWTMPRKWRRPMPPQPTSATGMRSGTIGRSRPSPVGERTGSDIEERVVATEKALQLVHHEAEKARPAGGGDTGNVRTHEHVGQISNRTPGGDRLRVEHVNGHADVASLGAGDQCLWIDDGATRD